MKVFVGCYTKKITEELVGKGKGIYCFDFDPTQGFLKLEEIVPALNPSYLTLSEDGKFLYAVEEIEMNESPKIKSYGIHIDSNKSFLTQINEQELPGSYACHLSISKSQQHVIVASYMSGNVLVYPLNKDGSLLPFSQNIQHHGSGPNSIRQEAAHAHMIYPIGNKGLYVVDLGLDLAKYYSLQESENRIIANSDNDLAVNPGAGARHMALHPNGKFAFIFSELTAELYSYELNQDKFEFLESKTTLPSDFEMTPSGAAIGIHPNGQFIYVANRVHNSIGIFRFDETSKELTLLNREPSGGKTPREFNIDPSGQWIIVANQDSDNLVVFKIDQVTGLLKKHHVNNDVKTASCIIFLED